MTTVYRFSADTGEYVGSSEALESPREPGVFLVPGHATLQAPPATSANEVAVMVNDAWEMRADFRGLTYWLADGSKHSISALGDMVPNAGLLSEPIYSIKAKLKDSIDTKAGVVRAAYVSEGALIEEEYRLALQQAKDWRALGSPAGAVPLSVSDWAVASGMTNEQAAADIEQTSTYWDGVLLSVRKCRLDGKAAVDNAGVNDDLEAIAQTCLDQLEQLIP